VNVQEHEKGEGRPLVEAIVVSAVVTAMVTAASALLPDRFVAAIVGFIFLGATWVLVWRRDDAHVNASGLSLGGLVLPGRIDGARLFRHAKSALFFAGLLSAITFGPFFLGFRAYWRPTTPFSFPMPLTDVVSEAFGQLVIIALPEEAFYRGYLQSRLERAMPSRVRVFGATVGPALLVTSLIFALGHVATIRNPARLAVFFPSLAFGWLRKRTFGIGAGVLFHAMCNIFSEVLARGYRLY
jgi:membrane protease YdiL (CAAX protease family)